MKTAITTPEFRHRPGASVLRVLLVLPVLPTAAAPLRMATEAALISATNATLSAANAYTDAADASLSSRLSLASLAATNYTDAATAALSAAKQDKMPYPTNAIPQGAVSGLSAALNGKLDNGGGTLYGSLYFEGEDRGEWDFINLYNAGEYPGIMAIGYKTYDRLFLFHSWDASFNMTTVRLPADKDGTLALTSDIPAVDLTPATNYTDSTTSALDSSLSSRLSLASQAATNYTDEAIGDISFPVRSVNQKTGAVTLAASDVGAYPDTSGNQLAQQVAAIGAHLNGEDARFVVTNYDSVVHTPEAYVEIKVSNNWLRVWDEGTRWNQYEVWKTNVDAELSYKADRAWGIYDSETGGYSPAGFTQVSSSNILIAAGMAYQRTVTSDGAVWVLQCNSGVAQVSGDTNGFFRVMDSDGVTQFEIIKGDRREMGCDASGISLDHSTTPNNVIIPYSVVSEEHPTLYITERLETPNWKAETDADCIGTVTWAGSSGAYVATVHPKLAYPSMFIRATYMVGGETYIRNAAPVGMDSIILNGTKYYLGTATISGHTVLTLSTTAP